jgi:ATP-dependent Clp protease adapter protein ClpS
VSEIDVNVRWAEGKHTIELEVLLDGAGVCSSLTADEAEHVAEALKSAARMARGALDS